MSNRFHSKYHRHNHHTNGSPDPRYPDSGHDPIASRESPFMGDFVMFGGLSSVQEEISAFAGSFVSPNFGGKGINIEAEGGTAIHAKGSVNITGPISVDSIEFTGIEINDTFLTPVTATGNFLKIKVNNIPWAIRLWYYDTTQPGV